MGRALLLALACAAAPVARGATKQAAEDLLGRFSESLLVLASKGTEPGDPGKGAIACPSTNPVPHGYHVRAAEAVFPFAVLANPKRPGADPKQCERFRASAFALGDWLASQQQPEEGYWPETPNSWWGTTGHQLFCLAAAYHSLADQIDKERATRWQDAMRRAADFIVLRFRWGNVPLSYLPTAACALTLCARLMPSMTWDDHARLLVAETFAHLSPDGLFVEEGKDGVDVGVNWGQTIPLLALHATLTRDEGAFGRVREAADEHLPFLWRDGTVDASWGCRVHRWTLGGSFGTYGAFAGLLLLGRGDSALRDAAARNLAYLTGCIRPELSGSEPKLLGYGPDIGSHNLGKDVCIYPTVCAAVGLAMALAWADLSEPLAAAGAQVRSITRMFPYSKVAVVEKAGLTATLSWSSFAGPGLLPPRGGAITHLLFSDLGTVQCATPSLFIRPEMLLLPQQKGVLCLTPRIDFLDGETWYSSLFDTETECSVNQVDTAQFAFEGSLCDLAGRSSGISYRLRSKFEANTVHKSLKLYGRAPSQAIIVREPIIPGPECEITPSADAILFTTKRGSFQIALESPVAGVVIEVTEERRHYFPLLPAVQAVPVQIRFSDPDETKMRWSIGRLAPAGKQ